MATPPPRQWGVTPSITFALPTADEMAADDDLIAALKLHNNFEPPTETERRKQMLLLLQRVTVEFVKSVCRKKGLSPAAIEAAGGKVFAYGSYRLGVYGPGSDIDTLVVGPKYVLIDDFFSDFPPILEKLAPPGTIEKMTPVPDAYVPIIKLELAGISIDLIYARLLISSVPMNIDLKNNDYLRGLDEKEVRSLNGTRVTDEILALVPQQKTFRLALRAVKLWAQRRAIYANIVGFPGGVAWAMLVARVCQLYPQATGAVIVSKFFTIMRKWNWPQPVMLKEIEDGPLQIKVWNPSIYHGDRFHLMPIITPAYPSMCATHNISLSTKAVLLRELGRGGILINEIFLKKRPWTDLFVRHNFFTKDYKYYLCITASSKTKEAEGIWSGLVESKLRHLVGALDRKSIIAIAHPFPKGFERIHHVHNDKEMDAVKAGSVSYRAQGTKTEMTDEVNNAAHQAAAVHGAENEAVPVPDQKFEDDSMTGVVKDATQDATPNGTANSTEQKTEADGMTVYTTSYYIGLELKPLEPGASRSLDISTDSEVFKSMCTSWPGYQFEVMDLAVTHVRNFDLPDDVFEPGETCAPKPKKKAKPVGQKRKINDLEDISPQGSAKRQGPTTTMSNTSTPV
ncbi:Poly(A) polymerase [Penicillium taxi]|uniref:Poly(A) polymerase n=1 Tax=Penicillium taxi TaxID=168475 RepID=UPI002544DB01|nr:Poly(A) polymerase [Penicillium taxi]KAJ5901547.1 Poly(A) polymerase [Penicillium taxi]